MRARPFGTLCCPTASCRDPAPSIHAVDLAVAAGATPTTDGLGDVHGPNGPLWCDGGPLDWTEAGPLPIVPLANLRIGSLQPFTNRQPSAELAPDQLAAVAHGGAGARIIAPAGSGKTRVLTERARHLIHDRGIDPRAICLLAFNVRARAEMQERTADLPGLEIRTLNSLALAIVAGRAPFVRPVSAPGTEVIDEHRVRRLLDGLVSRRRQAMADPMAVYLEALTATRLGLRSPEAVEREFGGDVRDFPTVLAGYREQLRHHGLLDFDEQILGAIEVLCTDPAARAAARRAAQIVLVDEFQDLTPAHVLLVRLLAGPDASVFGVGDDDQTIYGTPASPAWLIDFADLFPGSGAHDSPPTIAALRPSSPAPEPARPQPSPDRQDDRAAQPTLLTIVARRRRPIRRSRRRPVDVSNDCSKAVHSLGRCNPDSGQRHPARADAGLDRVGVPPLRRSISGFSTGPVSLVCWPGCGWLPPRRTAHRKRSRTALRRPPRGLGRLIEWAGEKRSVPELLDLARRLNEPRDQRKMADFAADLTHLREIAEGPDVDTATLLVAIRDEIGLGAALDNRLDASRRSVDRSAHGDDLAALLAVASLEPDPTRFPTWLQERLETASPDPDGVELSTSTGSRAGSGLRSWSTMSPPGLSLIGLQPTSKKSGGCFTSRSLVRRSERLLSPGDQPHRSRPNSIPRPIPTSQRRHPHNVSERPRRQQPRMTTTRCASSCVPGVRKQPELAGFLPM